ncbi:cytochrome c oxidase, cbb3-type, subunit III [Thiorhodovibrio winogradskyi]|uniref:Cytochrome c oxidase, cbb3-type, subunit III n=1 Tax=Thiorhodovibrio winogradskyi TaxID=77007 RepID=A0ABZ0SFM6_9GAMM|nr:cytochrome c [Thiorhodovibrio winogradskyi]
MKPVFPVASIGLCACLLIGCEPPPQTQTLVGLDDGKALFERLCEHCHKADGRGNFFKGYPSLKESTWQSWQIAHQLETSSAASQMPDFSAIPERQRKLIANYAVGLQAHSSPAGSPRTPAAEPSPPRN